MVAIERVIAPEKVETVRTLTAKAVLDTSLKVVWLLVGVAFVLYYGITLYTWFKNPTIFTGK